MNKYDFINLGLVVGQCHTLILSVNPISKVKSQIYLKVRWKVYQINKTTNLLLK